MKLFVLTLCVCAAMAEVHWDENGDYRLIETEPTELVEIIKDPLHLRISGAPAAYRIVGAPLLEEHPLIYKYLTPTLYPTIDSRLAAMAVKTTQPFVYSYKQVNHDA